MNTVSRFFQSGFIATMLAGLSVGVVVAQTGYPQLAAASAAGRQLWMDNCEACHAYGIAGAPDPTEPEDWRNRLGKPRELLYQHAIEGFFGPDDTQMPARGGNAALSDEQVRAAVDYMVALARHHINKP